jgi:hypothetical protein
MLTKTSLYPTVEAFNKETQLISKHTKNLSLNALRTAISRRYGYESTKAFQLSLVQESPIEYLDKITFSSHTITIQITLNLAYAPSINMDNMFNEMTGSRLSLASQSFYNVIKGEPDQTVMTCKIFTHEDDHFIHVISSFMDFYNLHKNAMISKLTSPFPIIGYASYIENFTQKFMKENYESIKEDDEFLIRNITSLTKKLLEKIVDFDPLIITYLEKILPPSKKIGDITMNLVNQSCNFQNKFIQESISNDIAINLSGAISKMTHASNMNTLMKTLKLLSY